MLVIEVISSGGHPPPTPMQAAFGAGGGTIGRGTGSTLVLCDPQRHISRTQATVMFQAGGYVITDTGTLNPISVNGRALGKGVQARLCHGDELSIGDYRLRVRVSADTAPPAPAAPSDAAGASQPSGAARDDPLALIPGGSSVGAEASNPFASLVEPAPRVESAHRAYASADARSAPPIPEDFDPFGAPPREQDGEQAVLSPPTLDVAPAAESIDALFELHGKTPVDPLAVGTPLGDPAPARVGGTGAVSDHALEIHAHYTPPPALRGTPAAVPRSHPSQGPAETSTTKPVTGQAPCIAPEPQPNRPGPAPAPSKSAVQVQPSASNAALLEAFLRGAGAQEVKFPGGLTPELMEVFGQLLREAVQGTLDLLGARTKVKTEIRVDVTIIEPRNNNPLKFSPTVDAAMMHLLAPHAAGFMTPVRALRDAFDDLRAHQVAMLAGMRAALTGLLARFAPERLERRNRQKSVLDDLVPMHRKAKQWDVFAKLYRDIRAEAEESFDVVFGKEFRRAYEAQMKRLARPDGPKSR